MTKLSRRSYVRPTGVPTCCLTSDVAPRLEGDRTVLEEGVSNRGLDEPDNGCGGGDKDTVGCERWVGGRGDSCNK